jgi:MFS family permease
VLIGGASERVTSRFGGRLPLIVAGAVLAVLGLVLLPALAGSLVGVAVGLAVFFVAYFVYYTPYYALFPDLVPEQAHSRSQGFQGTLRSAGLLIGIAGGGFLLDWWRPLPFVVGAVGIVAVTGVLLLGVRGRVGARSGGGSADDTGFVAVWKLVRDNPAVRYWTISNACWEAAIGTLRTFVVLYFTRGLGLSLRGSSGALALVGVAAVVAAPIAGKLGDRYGSRRVMAVSLWVFAIGLTPPLVSTNRHFIAAILPVAFAAVVLMTLPYALLMDLLPEENSNAAGAGLFGFSRGVGTIVGPLAAGLAVQGTASLPVSTFGATEGYSAIFAVTMVLLVASIPALHRAKSTE